MGNFKPQTTFKKVDLDSVFPNYRKISEAPTVQELEEEAKVYGLDLTHHLERERHRLYKSQDKWGNIWLIQNPSVWDCIEKNGYHYRVRLKPKLITAETTPEDNNAPKKLNWDGIV